MPMPRLGAWGLGPHEWGEATRLEPTEQALRAVLECGGCFWRAGRPRPAWPAHVAGARRTPAIDNPGHALYVRCGRTSPTTALQRSRRAAVLRRGGLGAARGRPSTRAVGTALAWVGRASPPWSDKRVGGCGGGPHGSPHASRGGEPRGLLHAHGDWRTWVSRLRMTSMKGVAHSYVTLTLITRDTARNWALGTWHYSMSPASTAEQRRSRCDPSDWVGTSNTGFTAEFGAENKEYRPSPRRPFSHEFPADQTSGRPWRTPDSELPPRTHPTQQSGDDFQGKC